MKNLNRDSNSYTAIRNSGRYTNKEMINNMKYVALISTTENLGTISNFIVNQLESHFKSWSSMDKDSDYSLYWRKNSLVLETDSNYLLSKWLNVEQQYLNYLLDESRFTVAKNLETMLASEEYFEELFDIAA